MTRKTIAANKNNTVVIVGSGIGGLAAAVRLACAGFKVRVLERHSSVGGKIRTHPSEAGPVDTGPTVLTMRHVFDELFELAGERLSDHVELVQQNMIARHFWPDGSSLDLFNDEDRNYQLIRAFSGARSAEQFRKFSARTRTLFDGFDKPMMQAPEPSLFKLIGHVAARPHLARQMAPLSTMDALLRRSFDDERLVQLFGRYATYVGGSPYKSPALLSLIWQAECNGVWAVNGGMHRLAKALADLAKRHGAEFEFDTHVSQISTDQGELHSLKLSDGRTISAANIVFNGDPRALSSGALGPECEDIAPQTMSNPRSLSAHVWAFAAKPTGTELAHHNVFFRDDPKPEFDGLERGLVDPNPTLYVCAMDRGFAVPPQGAERFEIIANAPPTTTYAAPADQEELKSCQMRTFQTLAQFGLRFDPMPDASALTTPRMFDALFPQTAGSLYGQSPHGTTAAFKRPTARTRIKGLYLVGGGAHPGAGVPMAALSARHAAEAILTDQTLTSTSPKMGMRGGTSTASATKVGAPSVSSGS